MARNCICLSPKHGSWLDIAEISINIMTRECLNRRIPSIEALKEELKAWNDEYDKNPSPVNWQFQADDSRIKLKRLYPDILLHPKSFKLSIENAPHKQNGVHFYQNWSLKFNGVSRLVPDNIKL